MNALVLRRILAALFVSGAADGAQAQGALTDATPASPARSLACLQRPGDPIKFPERNKLDHANGMMRVQLRFERPDAKPEVAVLFNTAREDMQDLVFRRLAAYRLPCLTPQDGVVTAVQEFNFNNSDREPLPLDDGKPQPFCIVMPRNQPENLNVGRDTEHVALAIVFSGDGQAAPEAKVIYSTGSRALERAVLKYASDYRMPCRTAGDPPRAMRQRFTYKPYGARTYAFKREGFGLGEFLSMTVGVRELEAEFDTNTMNCPFKVNYEALGPSLPNEVRTGGPADPNRALFLKWLAQRQLDFKDDEQRRDLWGTTLQINVPCGRLSLHPEPAKAG